MRSKTRADRGCSLCCCHFGSFRKMLGLLHRSPSKESGSLKKRSFNMSLSNSTPDAGVQPIGHNHTNGQVNGKSNGHATEVDRESLLFSPKLRTVSPLPSTQSVSASKRLTRLPIAASASYSRYVNTFVSEQHTIIRQRCERELGGRAPLSAFDTSYAGLLEWIRSERLTRMPHKGSSWDRVLIITQHFAEQVNQFSQSIGGFTESCYVASNLMYGHCLLLLELGHENATALEKAFNMFYQFGLELVPLLKRREVFSADTGISDTLGRVFSDLMNIVTAVAIVFYQAVHSSRSETLIEIYKTFAFQIETYRSGIAESTYTIWEFCLGETHGTFRRLSRVDLLTYSGHRLQLLQKLLAPQDSVLAFLAANRINITSRPAQFTCTWFQPELINFIKSDERILMVEGKPGSGKTTLASWTVDRLCRSIARRSLTTITYFFNSNIPAQKSSLSMVKTILYQLLVQRIGDVNLFHAINEAIKEAASLVRSKEHEDIMWEALKLALNTLSEADADSLVIIVDGINEIDGDQTAAKKACQRLYSLVEATGIRLVTFSQSVESPPTSFSRITLTPEYVYGDIATVARRSLLHHESFAALREPEQEKIVEQLAKAADTSILWVYLACQFILCCSSLQDGIKEILATRSVAEAVQKILTVVTLDQDAKSVISFMVAAQRPLRIDEIKFLLQAQTDRCSMIDRRVDVDRILDTLRSFVLTREGLIVMRHREIKKALINSTSKISLEHRHTDFVMKLLIYTKTCLMEDSQPTLNPLEYHQVEKKIKYYRFLEYAVRYWTVHLRESSFYKSDGNLDLPKDFVSIFPSSLVFALLEEGCWATQVTAQEAIDLYILAYRVRKTLFGEKYGCVLQSAIVIARFYESILCRTSDAIDWYVRATKICRTFIGIQSEMTIAICEVVLRISETLIVNKRNSIMTWREEILLIMISSYTQRYGESSKEVIEIMHRLVQLYICIEEEERVIEWKKKIEIIVGGSISIGGGMSREMTLKLKKHQHVEEIDYFDGGFLGGYIGEGEIQFTFEEVERFWAQIIFFIKEEQFERAEELYIELWLRLSEYCHHHHELDWHCKKIEIMLKYAHFLRTWKRESEACTILLCIWQEYEHHELTSFERINIWLKEVAICMKSMNLLSVSLAVFKKCYSYFKHTHKEETEIYKEIETHLTITSMEIAKCTTTTTTSETIIRGVFESACSSSEEVTETTVELCRSLTSTYIKEEKYSEAITCIEMALKKSWSSFFFESEKNCTLTTIHTSHSIELVMQLAHCYIMQKRYEKVEEIYVRLYRVHRKSYKLDHVSVVKYIDLLVSFYKEHHYFTKVISFYQELLVEYRSFYGLCDEITIHMLYALGDLCREHHVTHGYWIEYYLEIINNLNKGSLICDKLALRALIIVAEYHYEALRFTEALVYFKSIVETFCKHGTKYEYFEKITEVHTLIEHYFRSIEEARFDVETHISIVEILRESCLKYYAESSAICVMVTMTLASVYRRSEKHEFRAIELYEYVCKHSKTVHKEVRSSLQQLYYKRITTTTTTVTKETLEIATTMTFEKYCETRKSYSCTHERTLSELTQLIHLWYKQSKKELIIKEIQTILLEVIYIKSSKEIIECGKCLAQIYIECGYQSEAYELIHELRMQVIYGYFSEECGFKLTCGRECLAFIAALEYYVSADWSLTLAVLMADLIAEYSYYERLKYSIKTKASWKVVFAHGARLRRILIRRGRDFGYIENEAVNYFYEMEEEVTKNCHRPAIRQFVSLLFRYCMTHRISDTFTATVGHAAIAEIRYLIENKKPSLDLAKCTFYFLMAHEGLDDPTEITMGFQLCLWMSRGDAAMIAFSRIILAEVFEICKTYEIDIARIQLAELDELIEMIGQQKDYERLHWLLRTLWLSRESQTRWSPEAIRRLGMRLVQAEFAAGHYGSATRLCEDMVYNIKRVKGPRHEHTIRMSELLASLYTSIGCRSSEKDARFYFKKAMTVQEDVLRALVGWEEEDDDEDFITDFNGSVVDATEPFGCHQDEVDAVIRHVRKLRLAMQRLGGWSKHSSEFEKLTEKVWTDYGSEIKLKEDDVKSGKWKADKLGENVKYDCFDVPPQWSIVA